MSAVFRPDYPLPPDINSCTITTLEGDATYYDHTCVGPIFDLAQRALKAGRLVSFIGRQGEQHTAAAAVSDRPDADAIFDHLGIKHWWRLSSITLRNKTGSNSVRITRGPTYSDARFAELVVGAWNRNGFEFGDVIATDIVRDRRMAS